MKWRVVLFVLILAAMPWAIAAGREVRRVSLLLSRNWQERPREVRLVKWFQTHPVLKTVKAVVYIGKATLPTIVRPCVLVQRESDGYADYKVSGDNVPDTAAALAEGIFFKGRRYLFHWRRPSPGPTSDPLPGVPPPVFQPDDVRELEVPDTVEADPAEDDKPVSWLFPIFSALFAVAGTLAVKFRRLF